MTRYYSATAVDNTLGSAMTSIATSMILNATPVGYPTSYPFVLAVDYDKSTEELVLVTARAGLTLTVTRGFNGTAAVAHAVGALIRHVIAAQDLTDSQTHINSTTNVHGITNTTNLTTNDSSFAGSFMTMGA